MAIISEFEIRVFDRGSEVTSTSFSGKSPSSQITLPDLVYQRALQRTAGRSVSTGNSSTILAFLFTSLDVLIILP